MANTDSKPFDVWSSNSDLRDPFLQSLISLQCAPRQSPPDPRVCRLILDDRLEWALWPGAGNTVWRYLPQPVRAHQQAGCLILFADQT